MEIKLGDYGRMMFEMMAGEKQHMPEHWESIRAEAEPLVQQLLALNDKMVKRPGTEPYKIIGIVKNGKKVLADHERIRKAQERLWGAKVEDLKEGDKIWFEGTDLEHPMGEDEPVEVDFVRKGVVYVDMGRNGTLTISPGQSWVTIFRAPADYDEKVIVTKVPSEMYKDGIDHYTNAYDSNEYWLEQADKLGI